MNKDILLLRTVEVAAIAAYKFIGKKDKNAVDGAAVEAMQVMLGGATDFKLKVVNGEGELDEAPMLYTGQMLGNVKKKNVPTFDLSVDPIEGTQPAAFNFAGSIAVISVGQKDSMLNLPEMYMEKLFVANYLAPVVSLKDGIIPNVKKMQKFLHKKDLKAIVLDKPRHKEIIEAFDELGIIVRLIEDGDVLAAIDVVNGEADFVYGIGGAPEGVLMASLAIATGCKMETKLRGYQTIWPNEAETEARQKTEDAWLKENKVSPHQIFKETDLVNDSRTRFFAAGLTAGGTLKPINYLNGKFYVNAFMASHGIIRKINSIYDVNQINNLKPEIKYLFDKYKRK